MNSSKVNNLISLLTLYNNKAREAANGQVEMFSGEVKSKEDIIKETLNILGYGNKREVKGSKAAGNAGNAKQGNQGTAGAGERPGAAGKSAGEPAGRRLAAEKLVTDEETERWIAEDKEVRSVRGEGDNVESLEDYVRRNGDSAVANRAYIYEKYGDNVPSGIEEAYPDVLTKDDAARVARELVEQQFEIDDCVAILKGILKAKSEVTLPFLDELDKIRKEHGTKQQKAEGGVQEVSAEQRVLTEAVADLARKAGLEVVTDAEEGQRVLDEAGDGVKKMRVTEREYAIIASQLFPYPEKVENNGNAHRLGKAEGFESLEAIDKRLADKRDRIVELLKMVIGIKFGISPDEELTESDKFSA